MNYERAPGSRFENMGEFHAVEVDVLYTAPMSWHQMAAEARSTGDGWPSVHQHEQYRKFKKYKNSVSGCLHRGVRIQ